jgi:hypothetical protein
VDRHRTRSGFVAALIATILSLSVSGIGASERRKIPDYDGREPEPSTPGDVAIWVPRVVLAPPYLVWEYALRLGTDTSLKSEVYAYTRSRGLFAGAELSGAVVKQDRDATVALYRENKDFRTLLSKHATVDVDASRHLIDAIREAMR